MTVDPQLWLARPYAERREIVARLHDTGKKLSFADIGRIYGITPMDARNTYHNAKESIGDNEERNTKILQLYNGGNGISYEDIAARLNLTYRTVMGVINRKFGNGYIKNGRQKPPTLTEEQEQEIIRLWRLGDMSQPMIRSHMFAIHKVEMNEAWLARFLNEQRKLNPELVRQAKRGGATQSQEEWGGRAKTTAIITRPLMPGEPKPLLPKEQMELPSLEDMILGKQKEAGCMYIHGDPRTNNWQCCGHSGYPYCDWHYSYVNKGAKRPPDYQYDPKKRGTW